MGRRTLWTSEKGFVLATAAAAVGLGNIWRFPYIAGENGGGAFVLAYIVSVIFLGIPLMLMEISAGRSEVGSPVRTFRSVNRRAGVFGWLVVGLTVIIMSYYLAITGWTLGYALDSYTGSIRTFEEFTNNNWSLLFFLLVSGVTAFVVAKGVRVIEWLAKILMPVLIVIIIGLAGYSLTLDGAGEALRFLFYPDWSAFGSLSLWMLAFGQAFYSLAVGQGYLITYGSFLPKEVNLPRATGSIAGVETLVALIAGVMFFPIIFTFGLDPAEGTELAFTTLPRLFVDIPFGGVLAVLFFTLFFVAAISSCIAGMEVVKTAIREEFNLTQYQATGLAFLPVLPLGFFSALSFTPIGFEFLGRPFLEVLDLFAANQIVIASGIIGGAIISWSISKKHLIEGFGTDWKKLAGIVVNIVRIIPIVAALILILSWLV